MKKYYFRKKLLVEQASKLRTPNNNEHFYDEYDGKEVIFFSNIHGHCIDENGSAMFGLIRKEWCEEVDV